MTDTANTEIAANGTEQPVGTLEHLDPHSLTLELNVRDDADLDAQFVASIKEHGVLNPIAAVRTDDGAVWVRAGQRRTLAAREANLSSVPVYVRPASASDEAGQLVEARAAWDTSITWVPGGARDLSGMNRTAKASP